MRDPGALHGTSTEPALKKVEVPENHASSVLAPRISGISSKGFRPKFEKPRQFFKIDPSVAQPLKTMKTIVCDRISYRVFPTRAPLPRLGKRLNTRWNFKHRPLML